MEIWSTLTEYPNYKISNLGRIFNRSTGFFLKPSITRQGYMIVGLSKDGVQKSYLLHRLIADTFMPNYGNPRQVVEHINGIKTDNRAENLRRVSNNGKINQGVSLHRSNMFKSSIKINGKRVNKYFKSFDEAVSDYKSRYKMYNIEECTSIYDEKLLYKNK